MIVLDEQLLGYGIQEDIQRWYPGKVVGITELRPGTVIPDDDIPPLLCQERRPIFLTINVADFWRRVPADLRYCVVCCSLPDSRANEIPDLVRRLLRLDRFRTQAGRMGKVARISGNRVHYYACGSSSIGTEPLPPPAGL
jgi:hypothetical protein